MQSVLGSSGMKNLPPAASLLWGRNPGLVDLLPPLRSLGGQSCRDRTQGWIEVVHFACLVIWNFWKFNCFLGLIGMCGIQESVLAQSRLRKCGGWEIRGWGGWVLPKKAFWRMGRWGERQKMGS